MKLGSSTFWPAEPRVWPDPAVGDVVDAGAHDQALGHVAGLHERPEVLTREVGGERLAELVAVGDPALGLDRGAHGDELGGVLAPLVVVDVEPHPDHAVGPELGGLLLHPGHGQLAGVVHGLGQLGQLLALSPLPGLDAGVVDRRAHHEAEGMEPDLLDQQELVDREVGGEQAVLELLRAGGRPPREGPAGCGRVMSVPPMTMLSSAWRTAWLWAASALSDGEQAG